MFSVLAFFYITAFTAQIAYSTSTSAIYDWSLSSVHLEDHTAADYDKQFQVQCTVLRTQTSTTIAYSTGGCNLKKLSSSGDWIKVPSTPELLDALGIDEAKPIIVSTHKNGSTASIWHMGDTTTSLNT